MKYTIWDSCGFDVNTGISFTSWSLLVRQKGKLTAQKKRKSKVKAFILEYTHTHINTRHKRFDCPPTYYASQHCTVSDYLVLNAPRVYSPVQAPWMDYQSNQLHSKQHNLLSVHTKFNNTKHWGEVKFSDQLVTKAITWRTLVCTMENPLFYFYLKPFVSTAISLRSSGTLEASSAYTYLYTFIYTYIYTYTHICVCV